MAKKDAKTKNALEVGDKMKDGSIFVGISPDTGKQMFAAPADAGITKTFNGAAKYAMKLNVIKFLGHRDWRVPTRDELNVLFESRDKGALKGTFNLAGLNLYWSSTPDRSKSYAWVQRFSDGKSDWDHKAGTLSVRCVRG